MAKINRAVAYLPEDERKKESSRRAEEYLDRFSNVKFLAEARYAQSILHVLLDGDGKQYRLHAWCVMPSHVHALITPIGKVPVATIVDGWKKVSEEFMCGGRRPPEGLWSTSVFTRSIEDEEQFVNEVAYIENNPVGADLCETASDWEWSSARLRELANPSS